MQDTTIIKRRHRQSKLTNTIPEFGFLRIEQVLNILNISKTALCNGIQKGVYPKPKKLTEKTIVWSIKEIKDFVEKIESQNA